MRGFAFSLLLLASLSQAQCLSDTQCPVTQFCDIPVGAASGICKNFTGQCGVAIDHYGYECGPEPGCPPCPGASQCVNHKCVVIGLTCPQLGLIGRTESCHATENNKSCANCEYEVTSPDGTKHPGKTDVNGSIPVVLTMEGAYKIALIREKAVVQSAEMNALSRLPEEEKPQSFLSGEAIVALGFIGLLILAAAGLLLWRMRSGKKFR